MLTAVQAAEVLGITYGTLANWRTYGLGPKWKRERHRVTYDPADIAAWRKTETCVACGQPLPHRQRAESEPHARKMTYPGRRGDYQL